MRAQSAQAPTLGSQMAAWDFPTAGFGSHSGPKQHLQGHIGERKQTSGNPGASMAASRCSTLPSSNADIGGTGRDSSPFSAGSGSTSSWRPNGKTCKYATGSSLSTGSYSACPALWSLCKRSIHSPERYRERFHALLGCSLSALSIFFMQYSYPQLSYGYETRLCAFSYLRKIL